MREAPSAWLQTDCTHSLFKLYNIRYRRDTTLIASTDYRLEGAKLLWVKVWAKGHTGHIQQTLFLKSRTIRRQMGALDPPPCNTQLVNPQSTDSKWKTAQIFGQHVDSEGTSHDVTDWTDRVRCCTQWRGWTMVVGTTAGVHYWLYPCWE